MKITKVSYSMTRQLTAFHPASFSMEADCTENDNPKDVAAAIQSLVIKILYRDDAKQRDHLMNSLGLQDAVKGVEVTKQPITEKPKAAETIKKMKELKDKIVNPQVTPKVKTENPDEEPLFDFQ